MKARTVEDVILGEATYGTPEERFRDMLAIASVIDNRARQLGVTPEEVISAPGQFSAYNRALPAGVDRYRALAKSALDMVKTNGPVHRATFYATPDAVGNLPSGLAQVGQTTGHIYFDDPANRPIRTSVGFRVPQAITAEYSPPYEMAATTGAFSPSMVPSANAGPAGRAYSDLVPPSSVETTAVPGPGLAALAPNGLYGDVPSGLSPDDQASVRTNLADLSYGMGPHRPNAPSSSITDTIRSSVHDMLGPRFSVNVTSGTETDFAHPERSLPQYGSDRHKTGKAADFEIVDTTTGRVLNARDDAQAFRDVALAAQAKGALGTGLGTNYMGGTAMHFDKVQPGPGQANQWGNIGSPMADQFAEARQFGLMPASFYDRNLPQSMAAPLDRPMPETAFPDIALSRPEYLVTNASFSPDFNPSAQGNLTPSLGASTSLALDTPPAAPNTFDNMLAGMTKPAPPNLPQQDLKPAYAINADIVAPVPNAAPANMVSPDPGLFSNTPMSGMDFASFPKAPAAPSTWDKAKPHMKTALKDALIGGKMLGVPGMLGGFALGMSPAFGADVGFDFGPQFDEAMPESERFSTGFGLKGIESAMHGPRGATGTASNGSTYTSLGNGMGLRHSARYGWTEVVGPDGSVRGIHYNNGAGGIFGDISRALEGFFGGNRNGGGFTDAERDRYSKGVGLY